MRKIYGFFASIIAIYIGICALANLILIHSNEDNYTREYRVEINRLKSEILDIEQEVEDHDLEALNMYFKQIDSDFNYKYILSVSAYDRSDFISDFDKHIRGIHNDYFLYNTETNTYVIEYNSQIQSGNRELVVLNVILVWILVFIIIICAIITTKILLPFKRISNLPFELSKGNLTMPLCETKNKVFGKFIWGLDMLRDHIEEQKKNELLLQKEKKTLLLALSHDIKTPLSAIKLYAKALSKNLYKDEARKEQVINSISDKVIEMEGYLADIVKATSEDVLKFEVINNEFYIRDILTNIQNYYKTKLALNTIDFQIETNRNLLLYGDLERAEEVIQNVMENAIKYGDGNKIWINTTLDENTFTVIVGNTGCTLDSKELPHIFDSFWRGSNTNNHPGSGLGLYICRELMRLMKGEILAKIDENQNIYIYIIFKKF